jgi:hypothetical protein
VTRVGGLAVVALLACVPAATLPRPAGKLLAAGAPSSSPVREAARARTGPHAAGAAAALAAAEHDTPIAPPPATFDAPPPALAPPPAALHSASAPGRAGGVWAVIIGVDDYPGSGSDLRASVNDANDVDAALAAYGVPSDRRLVLRNTQATAATIADSLRWLVGHSSSDATAVFFYAGHVRKLGKGSEAIVAADGRVVTDVAMRDLLRPLAARQTWIAMASCYAGGFSEVLAPGRILTGAADANSLAYENSSYGRSYLVEYMVRRAMLQRQAPDSIEQSFSWAASSLHDEHPNRMPVQYDKVDGELRLGFPPPTAPAATAPAPQPGGGSPPPSGPPQDDPPPPRDDDCIVRIGSLVGCGV